MESIRSCISSFIGSPPFLTHYWASIIRQPPDSISMPLGTHGGHSSFVRVRKDHGTVVSIALVVAFSSSLRIMDRVERNVLPTTADPINFKNAFLKDFNMLAITGAIIAQVAITALALPTLNQVHWTSRAGFVVSLIFASLSVYLSTTTARTLSSLDSADEVRDWLSKIAGKTARNDFYKSVRDRLLKAHNASDDEQRSLREAISKFLNDNRWKQASFYSCLMLSAPSILLNLSLVLFLVALGLYLGTVWKKNLDPVAGDTASRAVFVCYVLGAACGIIVFFGASNRKDAEATFIRNWIATIEPSPAKETITRCCDVETGGQSKNMEEDAQRH